MPPLGRGIGVRIPPNIASHKIHSAASVGRERFLRVSEEVQNALATNKPVVALETTIYTHGRWHIV
jgi:pseudouridylate synthase / pseudouridine kinase